MKELILGPWAWYVVGPMISVIMFSMFYFGKTFGVSSNFKTVCTMFGADKVSDFFKFDWKSQIWNLVFLFGSLIGGFIAKTFLMNYEVIDIAASTKSSLQDLGINSLSGLAPSEIFSWATAFSLRSIIILVLGGFLIGFGTRYGGGCTSGHAITGLSNLQIPSLVAVIGFFIGGLIMTWFILPQLLAI